MKSKLEAIRFELLEFIQTNPIDIAINEELDISILWIENALLRLEAEEDNEIETWTKEVL